MSDLRAVLEPFVRDGSVPGAVALVARRDDVAVAVVGHRAFGDAEALRRDDLFRVASITKPIVAAAALTMVADGTIALDAPVWRWLPELADRRVLRAVDADLGDTEPARRPIVVEDLLTSRMGFGIVMADPGATAIQRAEQARGLVTIGNPRPPSLLGLDEWLARFAELPLMHHPGEAWMYQTSAQVLGALIERADGVPWFDAVRRRLLDPLGMVDTRVWVPDADVHRLTALYSPGEGGPLEPTDVAETSHWRTELPFPNAGAWLVSTIDDLWRFVEGRRRDDRLTGMTENRITATDARGTHAAPILDGAGWGYGLAVAEGWYGWDGGTGTSWRTYPAPGATGILLTQRELTGAPSPVMAAFWRWFEAQL